MAHIFSSPRYDIGTTLFRKRFFSENKFTNQRTYLLPFELNFLSQLFGEVEIRISDPLEIEFIMNIFVDRLGAAIENRDGLPAIVLFGQNPKDYVMVLRMVYLKHCFKTDEDRRSKSDMGLVPPKKAQDGCVDRKNILAEDDNLALVLESGDEYIVYVKGQNASFGLEHSIKEHLVETLRFLDNLGLKNQSQVPQIREYLYLLVCGVVTDSKEACDSFLRIPPRKLLELAASQTGCPKI